MSSTAPTSAALAELRASIEGRVVVAMDVGWDAARMAWNPAVDQRPAVVAIAESAEDVRQVVLFARAHGMRVAAQGTGHGAIADRLADGVLLLRTSRLTGVTIDAPERSARVAAGTIWEEVAEAAAPHGLAALSGTSGGVGVSGYTLGGGVGWLGRRHGLASNSVIAFDAVTADGRALRVDRESEPDLFWALRGGGGSFAVVTALEFRLHPVADLHAGMMLWPMERAAQVLAAWADWARAVPETVSSLGRLLRIPPLPQIPEPLRGRAFVGVETACITGASEGADLIAPLRRLGPEIDTVAQIPAAGLGALHMDPRDPTPGSGDGVMLREFTAAAVDALVDAAGPDSGSTLVSVEVRQLGGALARTDPSHGALDRLDAAFAAYGVGATPAPAAAETVAADLERVRSALAPWDAGRSTMNLAGRAGEAGALFRPETYRRLREIKGRYDPHDLLVANHPIPARAE